MKYNYHTISDEITPSLQEIGRWPLVLLALHQRLASYFARPEPYRHALLYLQAIVSEIPRKNSWQIAEHAKQARPYGMQRLLSRAVWDQEGVRNEVRTLALQCLNPPEGEAHPAPYPVHVIDESAFPKRGSKSAGVSQQYCGATGQVDTCQVGVFLSYVTAAGHALIDRELYLPEVWIADVARRQQAHIPETVCFQSKPQLARQMLQRVQSAMQPIQWVVADTVYGHSTDLRIFLQEQGISFALAVPSMEVVCVQTARGYRILEVKSIASLVLGDKDWHRLSMSLGTKGERLFEWAIICAVDHGNVDGRHWIVIRRSLDARDETAYYLVFAPLATIVLAIGARWSIEVDLENSKDLGLDQYEVRSYLGWYRHITLVLLACVFLLGLSLQDHQQQESTCCGADSPLIALSLSEIHHLLARLIWPASCSALLVCHWSRFRRQHQYWAGYYHRRRRLKASLPVVRCLGPLPSQETSWEVSWEGRGMFCLHRKGFAP